MVTILTPHACICGLSLRLLLIPPRKHSINLTTENMKLKLHCLRVRASRPAFSVFYSVWFCFFSIKIKQLSKKRARRASRSVLYWCSPARLKLEGTPQNIQRQRYKMLQEERDPARPLQSQVQQDYNRSSNSETHVARNTYAILSHTPKSMITDPKKEFNTIPPIPKSLSTSR